jgi:hypothetical protein
MADSSGFLGGDDSSRLDSLAKSIAENSEKLEILNKILGKVEDASSKKSENKSSSEILADLEKFVSKKDLETARKKALIAQADQDRLASNTFRASETIISEVLSRLVGTSFYPVLSAFRVARESVATATGTPQSELKVSDMIKFVNDSTSELIQNIFQNIGVQVGLLDPKVDELTKSIQAYKLSKQDEIDIQKELAPALSKAKEELSSALKMTKEELNKLDIDDVNKLAMYVMALEKVGAASKEETLLLDTLKGRINSINDSLKEFLNLLDPEQTNKLTENFQVELKSLKEEAPKIRENLIDERTREIKKTQEVQQQAKTIAGIAGLGAFTSVVVDKLPKITSDITNLGSALANLALTPLTGGSSSQVLGRASEVVSSGTKLASEAGAVVGAVAASFVPVLGPVLGPIVGSFVGKAVTETILAPLNIAAQTLISINNSVTQIAGNLVGFSPQITGAVVAKEIAILKDDFRRAALIGPQIARITEAQTKFELATRQAFDKFLITTEPYLVNILDLLTQIVEVSGQSIKYVQGLVELFAPWLPAALNLIGPIAVDVSDIAKKLGTEDPLEIASIANQGSTKFFANNPAAFVQLR